MSERKGSCLFHASRASVICFSGGGGRDERGKFEKNNNYNRRHYRYRGLFCVYTHTFRDYNKTGLGEGPEIGLSQFTMKAINTKKNRGKETRDRVTGE